MRRCSGRGVILAFFMVLSFFTIAFSVRPGLTSVVIHLFSLWKSYENTRNSFSKRDVMDVEAPQAILVL